MEAGMTEVTKGHRVIALDAWERSNDPAGSDFGPELFAQTLANIEAAAYQRGLDADKPAWIACEERMPEPGVPVLVFAYGRIVPHLDAVGFVTRSFMGLANHVTHWMPLSALPAPPSAGKGG
jgi:hypothetical protein